MRGVGCALDIVTGWSDDASHPLYSRRDRLVGWQLSRSRCHLCTSRRSGRRYARHVVVFGLIAIGVFDVALQYLRRYALSHTSNRLDVRKALMSSSEAPTGNSFATRARTS